MAIRDSDACFSNRPFGVKHIQTVHGSLLMSIAGSCFSSESAPGLSIMGFGRGANAGPLFLVELCDHDAQASLDTRVCYDIEEGAVTLEASASR
jgi:hypothetical protein